MNQVEITVGDRGVAVSSPFNREFVSRAKQLSGRFQGTTKEWIFPVSQEVRVRDLCREVYGTDGSTEIPVVTVRVALDGGVWDSELELCGRTVARAFDRDGGAKLAEGTVVAEGRLGSGGSRKNYGVWAAEGTILELLDVPRPAAESLVVDSPRWVISAEIVEVDADKVIALQNERAQLVARIAEIDEALGKYGDFDLPIS